MIRLRLAAIFVFLGACVRFAVYAVLWLITFADLQKHGGLAMQTSSGERFPILVFYLFLDVAVLLSLSMAFFFARPENANYRRWVVAGLVLFLLALAAPRAMNYVLQLFPFPLSEIRVP